MHDLTNRNDMKYAFIISLLLLERSVMKHEAKTMKEAIEFGLSKYRTGKRCIRGHDAPRYVSSGICTACVREFNRAARIAQNTRRAAQSRGLTAITVQCRPDDVLFLREVADALLTARPDGARPLCLWAHPDDAATMRELADAMRAGRSGAANDDALSGVN